MGIVHAPINSDKFKLHPRTERGRPDGRILSRVMFFYREKKIAARTVFFSTHV